MKCLYCGSSKTKVVDKRATDAGHATRRRRECLKCEKRFTTYERIESVQYTVLKKDGSRQEFDREKLQRGIVRSCEKRPVSMEDISKLVSEIESYLKNRNTTEISSSLIGRMVMTRLKKLDKVAYIRFASVYRDFEEPDEFVEVIDKLVS